MSNKPSLALAARLMKWDEVERLLTTRLADLNEVDYSGHTALSWASYSGNKKLVSLLLEQKGIDVNRANNGGYTPFHRACKKGHSEVVKLFINDNRVDLNKTGEDGWAPIHSACLYNQIKVVKLLLSIKKVDFLAQTTKDKDGVTSGSSAVDIARMKNHKEILKLFQLADLEQYLSITFNSEDVRIYCDISGILDKLKQLFEKHVHIKSILLEDNNLRGDFLKQIEPHLLKNPIESLTILKNEIGTEGIEVISNLVAKLQTLKRVNIDCTINSGTKLIINDSSIVAENDIGTEGAELIFNTIQKIHTFTDIKLSNNNYLTAEYLKKVEPYLLKNPIKHLIMALSNIEGVQVISNLIHRIPSIETFGIENSQLNGSLVIVEPGLRNSINSLILTKNNIENQGAQIISHLIRNINTLKKIRFENNEFNLETFTLIENAIINSSLEDLIIIQKKTIPSKFVEFIAKMIQEKESIKSLKIEFSEKKYDSLILKALMANVKNRRTNIRKFEWNNAAKLDSFEGLEILPEDVKSRSVEEIAKFLIEFSFNLTELLPITVDNQNQLLYWLINSSSLNDSNRAKNEILFDLLKHDQRYRVMKLSSNTTGVYFMKENSEKKYLVHYFSETKNLTFECFNGGPVEEKQIHDHDFLIEEIVSRHTEAIAAIHIDGCPLQEESLQKLFDFFKNDNNLEYLSLSNTNISSIPTSIIYLTGLKHLNLSGNSISNLPLEIKDMLKQLILYYDNTPLYEHLKNQKDLFDYLEELEKGQLDQNQIKIHIIGPSRAGKTSLVRALNGQSNVKSLKATVGIEPIVIQYPPKQEIQNTEQNETIYISCWDFGGQAELHWNHSMFFEEYCPFYLIVFDSTDKELETKIEYWIGSILRARKTELKINIILIGTRKNEPNAIQYNPYDSLKLNSVAKSRINLLRYFQVNLKVGNDLVKESRDIYNYIFEQAKIYLSERTKIPRYYRLVQKEIEKKSGKILKVEEIKSEMKKDKYGYSEEKIIQSLKFLNNTGEIVYFDDSALMKEHIFSDIEWLCHSISSILFAPNQTFDGYQGEIPYQEFEEWKKNFNTIEIDLLVFLFLQMGLCFKMQNYVLFPSKIVEKLDDLRNPFNHLERYSRVIGRSYISEKDFHTRNFEPKLFFELLSCASKYFDRFHCWKNGGLGVNKNFTLMVVKKDGFEAIFLWFIEKESSSEASISIHDMKKLRIIENVMEENLKGKLDLQRRTCCPSCIMKKQNEFNYQTFNEKELKSQSNIICDVEMRYVRIKELFP